MDNFDFVLIISVFCIIFSTLSYLFYLKSLSKNYDKYIQERKIETDDFYKTLEKSNLEAKLAFKDFVEKYSQVYDTLIIIRDTLNKGIIEKDPESVEEALEYLNECLIEDNENS